MPFVRNSQDDVSGCFEYYADLAEKLDERQDEAVAVPMDVFSCHVRREPIGVVGLITPWYATHCTGDGDGRSLTALSVWYSLHRV